MIRTHLSECWRDFDAPLRCSIDPVSLSLLGVAAGGLAGLGGAAASGAFSSGSGATPPAPVTPAATTAQPVVQPVGTPQGNATGATKSQAPTFLGAAATPQPIQSGQKTLLGA